MSSDTTATATTEVNLRALKLKPGMFLQTQHANNPSKRAELKFCAAIDGKGIMVVPLTGVDPRLELKANEEHIVRGFTGQYDFSFATRVIQLFTIPFAYTLLTYPDVVTARMVRKSVRIKASLPGTATAKGVQGPVTVVDLSVCGAMVESPIALGAIGDEVGLAFAIEFEGKGSEVAATASICHAIKADAADVFRIGMSFKNLARNDRLLLQYFALAANEAA